MLPPKIRCDCSIVTLLPTLAWVQFFLMFKDIRAILDRWTTYKKELYKRNAIIGFFVDALDTLLVALFIALVLRYFVIQTSYIPSGSMIPTLNIRDRLLVNKFIYKFRDPKRGEIVVFRSPHQEAKPFLNTFLGIGGETPFVKRLIGLPGDTVELKHGVVYVNDKQLILSGVQVRRDFTTYPKITIPKDHYFVLGDNRGNSADSRMWGFVPRDDFRGKAFFTFWPLNDMEWLK